MGLIRKALSVLAVLSLPALSALLALPAVPGLPALPALSADPVVQGPERGALVIVGGGRVGRDILGRLFDLAGGKDAPLVVIPTANGQDEYPADWSGLKVFKDYGATNITVLHTKDRTVADSDAFVRPLTTAKIVWFVGGRQWRLVDAYAHTRTQREVERVLERDGVVAGSSAGASILSSYLDESTAIVVRGQQFEVIGASKIAIHDGRIVKGAQERNGGKKKYFFMGPGEKYDLTKLERIGKPPRSER